METPKEKAIELYNKFRKANGLMAANGYAKKQALIAIDEIIKACTNVSGYTMNKDYWQEVKTELKKF